MTRAEGVLEELDRPVAVADRAASLADIDRLNAFFGGYRLTLSALRPLVARAAADRPLRIADVGGGRGDLARRVLRWGRRLGRPLRVVVLDTSADSLALGGREPGILRVRADATALPLRPGAVDVATASLTLHHLEPAAAVSALREMRAVARAGVVVNDLLRTPLSLGLVWLATRLFTRHPFSRTDGPLSVRRAYSAAELARLAVAAGLARVDIRRVPLLARVLLVAT